MELGRFGFGCGRNIGSGTASVGRDGCSRASARGTAQGEVGAGRRVVAPGGRSAWGSHGCRDRRGVSRARRMLEREREHGRGEMRGEERERARGERELKEGGGGGWPVQNIRTRA
jgi:hypothetical protein